MVQATMNVRIDENIKKSFGVFCADVGLTASAAVNMFVRATLRSHCIPLEITNSPIDAQRGKLIEEALRSTLIERIKESETADKWVDLKVMNE